MPILIHHIHVLSSCNVKSPVLDFKMILVVTPVFSKLCVWLFLDQHQRFATDIIWFDCDIMGPTGGQLGLSLQSIYQTTCRPRLPMYPQGSTKL